MPEPLPPVDDELAELFAAVANRDLTPDQQQQLASRLAANSDARAAFIHATAFDAMLLHEFPASQPRVASSALEMPEQITPASRFPKLRIGVLASVAACALLAIALVPWMLGTRPVATLASSEHAAWESSLPTIPGSELVPGTLKLKSGIATIRFHSGAEVVIEAPAQLELVSSMHGKLSTGAAVIDVPDSAIGFVIETPDGYAVDYGTRFAVRVDQHEKQSSFEIIEGEIAVHHGATGDEVRLIGEGKSATVSQRSIELVDMEQQGDQQNNAAEQAENVIRIGTNGRTDSVLRRDQKRHKFIKPEFLSVKRTDTGKWDHRSYFAFDLSDVDLGRVASARLRLNLVPSTRGYASRLPKINRFGIYGMTNHDKDDWEFGGLWDESPSPDDGVLLGTFDVPRSEQRGTFGIRNDDLLNFLKEHRDRPITLILVRETAQIKGVGPGLTHLFASDSHPEAVGPMLEFTSAEQ